MIETDDEIFEQWDIDTNWHKEEEDKRQRWIEEQQKITVQSIERMVQSHIDKWSK